MCPPKDSSAALTLHSVPRTKTPKAVSATTARPVGRKQRLRMATEKMNQLDSDLKDAVAGLKKGIVDFSDFDPD